MKKLKTSHPSEAAKFILLQRTTYIKLAKSAPIRILRKIIPFATYNSFVRLEANIRAKQIISLYFSDMEKEFDSLREYLPTSCSKILDIGCGIAGIDIFINRHYCPNEVDFYLLDKSSLDKDIHYMFEEKGSFYNSLDLAKATLVANGISENRVHTIQATDHNDINMDSDVELIISLISWGFHYPVSTYLDRVYKLLGRGGVLIIDIRKDTEGLGLIANIFGGYRKILEADKYVRVCTIKQ